MLDWKNYPYLTTIKYWNLWKFPSQYQQRSLDIKNPGRLINLFTFENFAIHKLSNLAPESEIKPINQNILQMELISKFVYYPAVS